MDVDNAPFGILLFKDVREPETGKCKWLPLGLASPIHQVGDPSSVSAAIDTNNDISECNLASLFNGSKGALFGVNEGSVADQALG